MLCDREDLLFLLKIGYQFRFDEEIKKETSEGDAMQITHFLRKINTHLSTHASIHIDIKISRRSNPFYALNQPTDAAN